jgi:hypothetical protein
MHDRKSQRRDVMRGENPARETLSRRRARAVIAAALLTATAACGSHGQPAAPTPAANDFVGQFNQLWSTFDRMYPYLQPQTDRLERVEG